MESTSPYIDVELTEQVLAEYQTRFPDKKTMTIGDEIMVMCALSVIESARAVKYCNSCRYWEPYEAWDDAPDLGECTKLSYAPGQPDNPTPELPAVVNSPAMFATHGSFYCKLWAPKR